MFNSGMNLFMAVMGFGISTLFIFSVCTRLLCVRITSRRQQTQDLQTHMQLRDRTLGGLEQIVVAKFPTKKFNSDDFSSEEDAQCSICLVEYQERDILRIMPKCGHAFHASCIDTWLLKQSTCPFCRLSLQETHDATSPNFILPRPIQTSNMQTLTIAVNSELDG